MRYSNMLLVLLLMMQASCLSHRHVSENISHDESWVKDSLISFRDSVNLSLRDCVIIRKFYKDSVFETIQYKTTGIARQRDYIDSVHHENVIRDSIVIVRQPVKDSVTGIHNAIAIWLLVLLSAVVLWNIGGFILKRRH